MKNLDVLLLKVIDCIKFQSKLIFKGRSTDEDSKWLRRALAHMPGSAGPITKYPNRVKNEKSNWKDKRN